MVLLENVPLSFTFLHPCSEGSALHQLSLYFQTSFCLQQWFYLNFSFGESLISSLFCPMYLTRDLQRKLFLLLYVLLKFAVLPFKVFQVKPTSKSLICVSCSGDFGLRVPSILEIGWPRASVPAPCPKPQESKILAPALARELYDFFLYWTSSADLPAPTSWLPVLCSGLWGYGPANTLNSRDWVAWYECPHTIPWALGV